MPTRSNHLDNPTVRRLLEAAEQEFEQHGFAGARVDGIAARARMAKSHVYYHFESKQRIFDDLVSLRLREILAAKEALATGIEALEHETLSRFLRRAVDELIVPRAAFIRIVLLESLGAGEAKARHAEPLLMRVLRPVLEDSLRRFEALGYEVEREAFLLCQRRQVVGRLLGLCDGHAVFAGQAFGVLDRAVLLFGSLGVELE